MLIEVAPTVAVPPPPDVAGLSAIVYWNVLAVTPAMVNEPLYWAPLAPEIVIVSPLAYPCPLLVAVTSVPALAPPPRISDVMVFGFAGRLAVYVPVDGVTGLSTIVYVNVVALTSAIVKLPFSSEFA